MKTKEGRELSLFLSCKKWVGLIYNVDETGELGQPLELWVWF